MINKICVKGLKSIRDLSVNCSNLNVFAGVNSSGKSTFLQALLIASQTGLTDDCLDGPLSLSLGEFREARNFNMPRGDIQISLWDSGYSEPAEVILSEQDDSEGYKIWTTDKMTAQNKISGEDIDCPTLPVYGDGLNYLSCHRIGPMDIYEKRMRSIEGMGIEGEHAFSYLLRNMENPVEGIRNPDAMVGNTLIAQVNHWLEYIAGTTLAVADLKKRTICR